MAKQKRRGTIERLERRYALTQFGIPWPDPQQVTFSFVPDGTRVAHNEASDLFASLNDASGASGWQAALMQALQTWAANTDVNFTPVSDGGEPLGTPGLAQGDPRFGDIRFAAAPLSSDSVALGTPFSYAAGTLAGDIIFNSNYQFGEGPGAQYDLFSVALHEIGHVLGLPDSTDQGSAMYPEYLGVRNGLTPADVTAVDALYGARPLDTSNQTLASATVLNPAGTLSAAVVDAQLATPADTHYYQYPVVDNQDVTIVVHTAGVSLLEPQLTVYDKAGNVVASATSTSPTGGDLVVHLHNAVGNPTLVINVSGASSVFGVGAYRLVAVSGLTVPDDFLQTSGDDGGGSDDGSDDGASTGTGSGTSGATSGSTGSGSAGSGTTSSGTSGATSGSDDSSDDGGSAASGSTGSGSTTSGSTTSASGGSSNNSHNNGDDGGGDHGGRHSYSFHSTLAAPADAQIQHVTVPGRPGSQLMTLTATVWAEQSGAADPVVTVTDSSGNVVAAQILENTNGTYSLQVVGVAPGAVYTVAVAAADPAGTAAVGRYRLAVDFDSTPVQLTTYASGAFTATASDTFQLLQVNTSQFFQFLLSAADASTSSSTPLGVTLAIYDTSGNLVQSVVNQIGSDLSTTVLLEPGQYVLRLAAATQNNSALPDTIYQLLGTNLGDGIGPQQIASITSPPPMPPPFVFVAIFPLDLYLMTLNGQFGGP